VWRAPFCVLMFRTGEYLCDYPERSIVVALRSLLPALPADMAAAMQPIVTAEPTATMRDVYLKLATA